MPERITGRMAMNFEILNHVNELTYKLVPSEWNIHTATGRNQLERVATFWKLIEDSLKIPMRAQKLQAINENKPVNEAVILTSPNCGAVLERHHSFISDIMSQTSQGKYSYMGRFLGTGKILGTRVYRVNKPKINKDFVLVYPGGDENASLITTSSFSSVDEYSTRTFVY
jgi:hypothetical protein